jgi:2,4'-dihydroxyacetophenone dioxygenase
VNVTFNVIGPLIRLDENGDPDGTFDVFDCIALCREHYDKVGLGSDHIDGLMR